MGVALRRVEEDLGQLPSTDVLLLRRHVAKEDLLFLHTPLPRLRPNVRLACRREAQKPEDAVLDPLQHRAPNIEDRRVDLVELVKVAVYELILRHAVVRARFLFAVRLVENVARRLAVVVDEVGVRHVGDLLAVVPLVRVLARDHVRVGDHVLDVLRAHRPAEAHVRYLYGRGPEREDLVPRALRVSVEVDQHVHAVGVDQARGVVVCERGDVAEALGLTLDLLPPHAHVGARQRVAGHLHAAPVVHAEERLGQVAKRVVAQVGADVAHVKPLLWLFGAVAERRHVEQRHICERAGGVALRDLERDVEAHLLVDQRVEGLHRRKHHRVRQRTLLLGRRPAGLAAPDSDAREERGRQRRLELLFQELFELLHVLVSALPVANEEQRVDEVGERVGEVLALHLLLELDGLPVTGDRLLNVASVLVGRGEVRVGVSELRLQPDGRRVAFDGVVETAEVFVRVAHVRISVGKERIDRHGLVVMSDSLLELALLLEDRAKVRVGRGEARHEARGGHVAVDGLLHPTLILHRVAEVVVRVRVVGFQPERRAVAVDRFVELRGRRLAQGVAEVVVGVWKVRLELDGVLERLDRLSEHVLVIIARGQIAVGDGKVGPDGEGGVVAAHRLVDQPLLLERVAKVRVGVRELRAESDGLTVVRDGGRELALILEDARQVGPGNGEVRTDLNRLQVRLLRKLEVTLRLVKVAKVAVSVDQMGRENQRHLVGLDSLLRLPELHVGERKVIVGVAEARLELDRLVVELNRALQITKLLQCVAEVRICLGKVRVDSYALLVIEDAFREVAQLEVDGAEQKKILRAVGVD
mmetsp:Transcript_96425/g.274886  ORF Transcript_96425/g.274886 Transcript_96425/m.274886 type:complete len:814 (+) Transcript_96425:667-3108(+)